VRCPRCLVIVGVALAHFDDDHGTWQCRENNAQIYATCPGCGDRGDAAHIAACSGNATQVAFCDGALWLLLLVELQRYRRGDVDFGNLLAAVAHQERMAKRHRWSKQMVSDATQQLRRSMRR
jgi:hypothetical protein